VLNHTNLAFLDFFILFYFTGLDSERAGSRTLEKSSRRDRDRVCSKFESSRRFRGSNMNPQKKSRRCRGHGLDSGLDLAISRFIYSFAFAECIFLFVFQIYINE
jgi:hypothetical protein